MPTILNSITYAQITISYGPGNKKNVFCALPNLPEDPLKDEILEAALDLEALEEDDLNFDCTAVEIEEEDYISMIEIEG